MGVRDGALTWKTRSALPLDLVFARHLDGVRRRLGRSEKARLDRKVSACIEPAVITRGVGFGGVSTPALSAMSASGREFDIS